VGTGAATSRVETWQIHSTEIDGSRYAGAMRVLLTFVVSDQEAVKLRQEMRNAESNT